MLCIMYIYMLNLFYVVHNYSSVCLCHDAWYCMLLGLHIVSYAGILIYWYYN
jgi:hypothetical protein